MIPPNGIKLYHPQELSVLILPSDSAYWIKSDKMFLNRKQDLKWGMAIGQYEPEGSSSLGFKPVRYRFKSKKAPGIFS